MKNIVNLLPHDYFEKIEKRRKFAVAEKIVSFSAAVLGLLVVISFIFVFLDSQKVLQLNKEINELQAKAATYEKYNEMDKHLQSLTQQVSAVKKHDKHLINKLSDIVEKLPEGIWLENISVENSETNINMSIRCKGNVHGEIAQTIASLKTLSSVDKIEFRDSSNDKGAISFTIIVSYPIQK